MALPVSRDVPQDCRKQALVSFAKLRQCQKRQEGRVAEWRIWINRGEKFGREHAAFSRNPA